MNTYRAFGVNNSKSDPSTGQKTPFAFGSGGLFGHIPPPKGQSQLCDDEEMDYLKPIPSPFALPPWYQATDVKQWEIPPNSFLVAPDTQVCIKRPKFLWGRDDYATYVFSISFEEPFSHICVCQKTKLKQGWAAVIYGRASKKEWEKDGETYFMGDLRPDKLTAVFDISQPGPVVKYVLIYIVIVPEVVANGITKKHRQGGRKLGPFSQLF